MIEAALSPSSSGRTPTRARNRRMLVRRSIMAIVGAGALFLVATSLRPKPIMADMATVARGPMKVTVDEAGHARVRDKYIVSAPFAGNLARIELRPGDAIRASAIVATIVPAEPPLLDPRARAAAEARIHSAQAVFRQAEATVHRAELALVEAQRDLTNTRALADRGTLSPDALAHAELELRMRESELASARFAREVASSEVTAARAGLGLFDKRTTTDGYAVLAPVTGRVLRVLHTDAGVVAAGTPLIEVGDPGALEIVVDVLTADAVRMAPGAKATLEGWGGPPIVAHVRTVEPSAFTRLSALGVEEQRVNVIVDLDGPRDAWAAMGDGWRVESRIVVWAREDVVSVPSGAVFRRGDDWASFVVVDGRAVTRKIRVGQRGGNQVQIEEGLAAGDRVIVHPSERIAEGVRVASP